MMGHQNADFVNISSINYAEFAKILGGQGFVIETAQQLRQAFHLARESDTFSILDVRISPDDLSPASQRVAYLFAKTLKG